MSDKPGARRVADDISGINAPKNLQILIPGSFSMYSRKTREDHIDTSHFDIQVHGE